MPETLRGLLPGRRERSCALRTDRIRLGRPAAGVERADVFLRTRAFTPHRHDTYAIGVTTAGVQTFRYRGARRVCLPGELHVLHPDELHDGAPGTDDGFGYRILYVAPELVGAALAGGPLPFVVEPVQRPAPPTRALVGLLVDLDEPVDELAQAELAATVADALLALAGRPARRPGALDGRALERAREHLAARPVEQTPAAELERLTGLDRFTLTRQFRRAFGTTPDRYRTLRRLELARAAIERGEGLARAAAEAGFADQSHLSRQFRRAYGLSPGRWRALTAARSGDGW